jgi:hypothetical protein
MNKNQSNKGYFDDDFVDDYDDDNGNNENVLSKDSKPTEEEEDDDDDPLDAFMAGITEQVKNEQTNLGTSKLP